MKTKNLAKLFKFMFLLLIAVSAVKLEQASAQDETIRIGEIIGNSSWQISDLEIYLDDFELNDAILFEDIRAYGLGFYYIGFEVESVVAGPGVILKCIRNTVTKCKPKKPTVPKKPITTPKPKPLPHITNPDTIIDRTIDTIRRIGTDVLPRFTQECVVKTLGSTDVCEAMAECLTAKLPGGHRGLIEELTRLLYPFCFTVVGR